MAQPVDLVHCEPREPGGTVTGPTRALRLLRPAVEDAAVEDAADRERAGVTGLVDALRTIRGALHVCVAPPTGGAPVAGRGPGRDDCAAILALAAGGGLEDVLVTTGRHHHLVRPSVVDGAAPQVVHVTVRRDRTTLAAARRELAVRLAALTAEGAGRPPGAQRAGARPDALPALPRRRSTPPPHPSPVPPAAAPASTAVRTAPVLAQSWARDVATLRRLLTGLARLS